jgi:hypothetical protein
MKNYEEIDREEAVYVRAANDALASMRDEGARWWSYIVSHSTFELVVGDPLGKDNLVLCLTACEYISGPVSWSPQKLEVIWHCDRSKNSGAWRFVLQDESVGFKVEAFTFAWRKNYNMVQYHSMYLPRRT